MTREPINNWCHIFAVFCWDPKPLVLSEMPRPFDADWYLSALKISMDLLDCEIANSQCQQNLRHSIQTWTLGEPKWWTKHTTTSWVHSGCSGWIILQGEQRLKMRLKGPNYVQSAKPKKELSISPTPILTKFCNWPHHFTQQLTIQKQNTLVTTHRLGLGDLCSGLVFKVHIESSSHSSLPQVYIVWALVLEGNYLFFILFGRVCGVPPFTLITNVRYNLITDDVSILLSMWWPYASETSAG